MTDDSIILKYQRLRDAERTRAESNGRESSPNGRSVAREYQENDAIDVWSRRRDWADILLPVGYTLRTTLGNGERRWTRPGKSPSQGHSAVTHEDPPVMVSWSSTGLLPDYYEGMKPLTKFRVFAYLYHGQDERAARRAIGEQLGEQFQSHAPPEVTLLETSDDDNEFWKSDPMLEYIRDFARARMVGPWAVLGVILARIIVATLPNVVLPPTVGSKASLNLYIGLVGKPGLGKGIAESVAAEAIDVGQQVDIATMGSGEGIAHLFRKRERNGEFTDIRHAVLFSDSEVSSLEALVKRQGATLWSQFCKAFSGERLGFNYADPAKAIPVDAHAYRLCVIIGIQPGKAGFIMHEAPGGIPQRIVWLPTHDVNRKRDLPEPERMDWNPPDWLDRNISSTSFLDPSGEFRYVEVCQQAQDVIKDTRELQLDPKSELDELDAHAVLVRVKLAAALGLLLYSRAVVDDGTWWRAGYMMRVSDGTRQSVLNELAKTTVRQSKARGESAAVQQQVVEERLEETKFQKAQATIVRKLDRADDWVAHGELNRAMGRHRDYFEVALDSLIDKKTIEVKDLDRSSGGHGGKGASYRLPRT